MYDVGSLIYLLNIFLGIDTKSNFGCFYLLRIKNWITLVNLV